MKLYFTPGTCSLADHIALEWIGKPYDAQLVSREERRQPAFLAINPAGAVPVLDVDGWLLTQNSVGQKLVTWWDAILRHIPIVGPLYTSVKQVSDTLLSSSGNAFRKALLVQWPREGMWTIAFLTGTPGRDVTDHLSGDYLSIYVPTTPNPTGGYFVIVKRSDVIELDMSVDAALKYIVSMGVVSPNGGPRR